MGFFLFFYLPSLIYSTLLYSTEPLKKGRKFHKAEDFNSKPELKPGDMLVYKGMILEHWRDTFLGDNCAQVFLHYNDVNSKDADKNIYDTRPHLGLPAYFKGVNLNS